MMEWNDSGMKWNDSGMIVECYITVFCIYHRENYGNNDVNNVEW